jgi:nicotinamidase-related amidase
MVKGEDCVLVIIDVQEKLWPVVADKETVRDNCVRLAEFARIVDLPVLYTEQEKLGPTLPEVREPRADAPAAAKISFDCFGEEAFNVRLKEINRPTLILCGIEAHICVAQTALSGLGGYRVQVVGDAASSRNPENKELAWRRLIQAGCEITSTEMFIYEILRQAGTDHFRAALKLVK